jgi:hypothetical protein
VALLVANFIEEQYSKAQNGGLCKGSLGLQPNPGDGEETFNFI